MAYSVPLVVVLSFELEGLGAYLPLFYAFLFVPVLELLFQADPSNLSQLRQEVIKEDPIYDWLLYGTVLVQYAVLGYFLSILPEVDSTQSLWGRITGMGLMSGVIGINVGHELGHRRSKLEQNLAKLLLGSSLYGHFFIEHNYGHHRNVGTPEDPASARYNESLYLFWFRSIIGSYHHAWKIQKQLLKAKKKGFWSKHNELLRIHLLQLSLLVLIYLFFGGFALACFMAAAVFGMILLETVNYIEHYGLSRAKVSENRYENANPSHSWNSDHLIGRLLLFELSRHSDHHAHPHRKYQILEHHDESPQLPTGYPGMMLLSTLPPLWFFVMNRRVKNLI